MVIRRYRPDDRARLREICVRTGAAGGDATGRWSSDDLLPDVFLDPYLVADPEWAWVADDGSGDGAGAVGYLVATPDTRAFARWWRREWTPQQVERHPRLVAGRDPAESELVERLYDPEVLTTSAIEAYPAHLHIDLLPEAQGRGLGRALIETLIDALAAHGVPGVHLTIDPANTAAAAFYERIGFARVEPGGALFVRAVDPEAAR